MGFSLARRHARRGLQVAPGHLRHLLHGHLLRRWHRPALHLNGLLDGHRHEEGPLLRLHGRPDRAHALHAGRVAARGACRGHHVEAHGRAWHGRGAPRALHDGHREHAGPLLQTGLGARWGRRRAAWAEGPRGGLLQHHAALAPEGAEGERRLRLLWAARSRERRHHAGLERLCGQLQLQPRELLHRAVQRAAARRGGRGGLRGLALEVRRHRRQHAPGREARLAAAVAGQARGHRDGGPWRAERRRQAAVAVVPVPGAPRAASSRALAVAAGGPLDAVVLVELRHRGGGVVVARALVEPRQDAVGDGRGAHAAVDHLLEQPDAGGDVVRLDAAIHKRVVDQLVAPEPASLDGLGRLQRLVQVSHVAVPLQQGGEGDQVGLMGILRVQHLP
mmetsp:Transcript_28809/g.76677  ORF Transcript_28809/g.76677 Transcript_28809/m.76677 type:complete len:391 (-) Transcript_28809:978-2150(-)